MIAPSVLSLFLAGKSYTILGMISALHSMLQAAGSGGAQAAAPQPLPLPDRPSPPPPTAANDASADTDDDNDADTAPWDGESGDGDVGVVIADSSPLQTRAATLNVIDLVSSDEGDDACPAAPVRVAPRMPETAAIAAAVEIASRESAPHMPPASLVPSFRFLVCAPSNAAVDHLVSLMLGLPTDAQLAMHLASQVRVGFTGFADDRRRGGSQLPRAVQLPARWSAPPTGTSGGLLGVDGCRWTPSVVRIGAGSLAVGRHDLVQVRDPWVRWAQLVRDFGRPVPRHPPLRTVVRV